MILTPDLPVKVCKHCNAKDFDYLMNFQNVIKPCWPMGYQCQLDFLGSFVSLIRYYLELVQLTNILIRFATFGVC